MGRTLKRVPLDFDWPIGQLWKGYLNPYQSMRCKSCEGSGLNEATKELKDAWYSFDKTDWAHTSPQQRFNNDAWQYHLTEVEVQALFKAGRLSDLTDKWYNFDEEKNCWMYNDRDGTGWKPCETEPKCPSPEEVNEWSKTGFGHDGLNHHIAVRARAEHLGVYGKCAPCKGDGELWHTEELKKLNEDWNNFDPPEGDGYQLWNTTTEGHPMSPVFETLDELCEWCETKATTFASMTATKEQWMNMLSDDHVHHREGNMIFL